MVKIQVVRNEKKEYECKVLDASNYSETRIITPRNFTVTLSYMFHKHILKGIKETKQFGPFLCYVIDKNNFVFLHPIQQDWIYAQWSIDGDDDNKTEMLKHLWHALQLDIINFALEHDRKELMSECLQHLCTRSTVQETITQVEKVVEQSASSESNIKIR